MSDHNRAKLVIEGDASVNPDALRIVSAVDLGIDVLFVARDDDLAPDPMDVAVEPSWVARIALSICAAQIMTSLKKVIAEQMRRIEQALDKFDADADDALAGITEAERHLRIAKARILGAKTTYERERDSCDADAKSDD